MKPMLRYTFVVIILGIIHSEINEINYNNINGIINQKDVIILNFYATWCPYSRMFEPIFNELDDKLQKSDFKDRVGLARIDGSNNGPIALKYGVNHFPALLIFRKGHFTNREYHGYRKVDDLYNFIKEISNIKPMEISDLSQINNNELNIYIKTPSKQTPEYIIYERIVENYVDKCKFYTIISDKDPQLGFKTDSPYEQADIFPDFKRITSHYLTSWLDTKCNPFVREITFENAESIILNQKPLFILFYNSKDRSKLPEYVRTFENLKVILASYNIVVANAEKFIHALSHVKRTIEDTPFVAFDDFKHIYYFGTYLDLKDIPKVIRFTQDYSSGELHRRLHEEMQIKIVIQLDEPVIEPKKNNIHHPNDIYLGNTTPKNPLVPDKPSFVSSLFKKLLPDSSSFSHVKDTHEL